MKLDKLDILTSEFARRRAIKEVGGCERCLTPKYSITKEDGSEFPAWKQLQCAHYYGRSRKITRYDPDNVFGFCGACHIYFTSNPNEFIDWFIKTKGQDKLDLLQARMRIPARYLDRNGIELYLKEEIRKFER